MRLSKEMKALRVMLNKKAGIYRREAVVFNKLIDMKVTREVVMHHRAYGMMLGLKAAISVIDDYMSDDVKVLDARLMKEAEECTQDMNRYTKQGMHKALDYWHAKGKHEAFCDARAFL